MTLKVNGFNKQGTWFERDTSIIKVEITAGTSIPFSMPVTVRNGTSSGTSEQFMGFMQTRGTVIAYNVVSDTEAHYMFGHAAGYWGVDAGGYDVLAEIKAGIENYPNVTTAEITLFEGFVGAVPVVESYVQPSPPF